MPLYFAIATVEPVNPRASESVGTTSLAAAVNGPRSSRSDLLCRLRPLTAAREVGFGSYEKLALLAR